MKGRPYLMSEGRAARLADRDRRHRRNMRMHYAVGLAVAALSVWLMFFSDPARTMRTNKQLAAIADRLDRARVPETGAYTREQPDESDAWGTPLRAEYGEAVRAVMGVRAEVETLCVVSAGPDREFGTDDDLRSAEHWADASGTVVRSIGASMAEGAMEALLDSWRRDESEGE